MPSDSALAVPSVMPMMRYRDVAAAIDWLVQAFGFDKHMVVKGEDGQVIYAQLTFGDGLVMVGPVGESDFDRLMTQPDEVGGAETQTCYLAVENADWFFNKAKTASAEIVLDLKSDASGGRGFAAKDPEGHVWNFGTYDPWAAGASGKPSRIAPPAPSHQTFGRKPPRTQWSGAHVAMVTLLVGSIGALGGAALVHRLTTGDGAIETGSVSVVTREDRSEIEAAERRAHVAEEKAAAAIRAATEKAAEALRLADQKVRNAAIGSNGDAKRLITEALAAAKTAEAAADEAERIAEESQRNEKQARDHLAVERVAKETLERRLHETEAQMARLKGDPVAAEVAVKAAEAAAEREKHARELAGSAATGAGDLKPADGAAAPTPAPPSTTATAPAASPDTRQNLGAPPPLLKSGTHQGEKETEPDAPAAAVGKPAATVKPAKATKLDASAPPRRSTSRQKEEKPWPYSEW